MKASQWDRLLSAACDGQATGEEMDRLAELIRDVPGLRDDYLFYVDTHACLAEDCADPAVALSGPSPSAAFPFGRTGVLLAAGLAVLALALAAIFAWGGRNQPHARVPFPFLAVVINADGALWEGEDASVMIGSALGPGLVELCEGRVELELDNGVRLAIEGPARFELESLARGVLHQGRLGASVPPEGIGFKIDTPTLSVIDLGTEFSLNVSDSGVSDVHVFAGEVEASLRHGHAGSERKLLSPSLTRRARPTGSRLETVDFDPRRFVLPPLQVVSGVERVSGHIRALANPPETVRPGTYQHHYMLLFREQTGVELENPLAVSFAGPGCHRFAGEGGGENRLGVGERIDSYFIHYDVRVGEEQGRVRGSVRFTRPVVGVIAGERLLSLTDDLLGVWCTRYDGSRSSGRGLENDLITISGDRRTLTLDWAFDGDADQVRVLVAAED